MAQDIEKMWNAPTKHASVNFNFPIVKESPVQGRNLFRPPQAAHRVCCEVWGSCSFPYSDFPLLPVNISEMDDLVLAKLNLNVFGSNFALPTPPLSPLSFQAYNG